MTAARIRNGIDLDALESGVRAHDDPPQVSVRTEWIGGAQSVATISRAASGSLGASTFVVHVDESPDRLGNGTAPAPTELAAVALSAAFAEAFIIEASRGGVVIDALAIAVHTNGRTTSATDVRPGWRIDCSVDSAAPLTQLRAFGRAAADSGLVRSLAIAPSVSVARMSEKEGDMT